MWIDAAAIAAFYATPLGQTARRVLARRVRGLWPDTKGLRVLCVGYGGPLLTAPREEAERCVIAMPMGFGARPWPNVGGPGMTVVDDVEMPFADRLFDRILVVHCLEGVARPPAFLRELWRVLADDGRIIAVVPNRRGLWARFENTPFGWGRPYSSGQITHLLGDSLFELERRLGALYFPPLSWRLALGSAIAWERLGGTWLGGFAGVHVIEASKRIYAGEALLATARKPRRGYLVAPQGLDRSAAPEAKHGLFGQEIGPP